MKIVEALRDETIASKEKIFFIIARDPNCLGYLSSEIGCTQHVNIFYSGRYDGDADYTPGQKLGLLNI
jgi:hypothetical protein